MFLAGTLNAVVKSRWRWRTFREEAPRVRGALALVAVCATVGTRADAGTTDFFEARIRPVLVAECYECHGPEKQKGGLRVDYREGLRRGGDRGAAILPGDAGGSLLYRSITHQEEDLEMPSKRPKLGDRVIGDFKVWIEAGATDPREEPTKGEPSGVGGGWAETFRRRLDWWSFRPVADARPPEVSERPWSEHPVDRFILERLSRERLRPSGEADARTRLRRLSYVLTGLPPAPEEMTQFLADEEDGAWERQADRLLNSPRFGERWARHWSDLMRYAETHGSEGDPKIPYAWRYRDYLIRAFNEDVPLDQLIREHVAGDVMDRPRWSRGERLNESALGTASLRLVEHGFQPVDTLDDQIKSVDNLVDVTGKAFQGLTISCARCHDHKFDPISQADYYAVYGVLAAPRPALISLDAPETLRAEAEVLARLKARLRAHLASDWTACVDRLADFARAIAEGRGPRLPGDDLAKAVEATDAQIREVRSVAANRAGRDRDGAAGAEAVAMWTFEDGTRDVVGELHGVTRGRATLRGGRLVLNGEDAFMETPPLVEDLREKTLEAWVALSGLEQSGGGVLTVETSGGGEFDSVVFGEQEAGRWMAGSENFRRTRSFGGPRETATNLVHVAVAYGADGEISFYRDGEPYGKPYRLESSPNNPVRYEAGRARMLIGRRHTGGGRAYLRGEIEEARVYGKALTPAAIRTSYERGPTRVRPSEVAKWLTVEERSGLAGLETRREALGRELATRFPDHAVWTRRRESFLNEWEGGVKGTNGALMRWRMTAAEPGELKAGGPRTDARIPQLPAGWRVVWDLTRPENGWERFGAMPPRTVERPGEFSVVHRGEQAFAELLPRGTYTHLLSERHSGVLQSPRFRVETDRISVLAMGGGGARVRLVVDHYPLGNGNIFPQATLSGTRPSWVTLDTAYRKGSMAYLELAPADEVTARDRSPTPDGRSYFGVMTVAFHEAGGEPGWELMEGTPEPRESTLGWRPAQLSRDYARRLREAIAAWKSDRMTDAQAALLNAHLRARLLPRSLDELGEATATVVREYRETEARVAVARRAPGVREVDGEDAMLLERGDPARPGSAVPRGYLSMLGGPRFEAGGSGRLALAEALTSPTNPLTARVLANRIWGHVFGAGLVATVDNFGRLGETPSHPELLDYLAMELTRSGWSLKALIRLLVTSRTFRGGSAPEPGAEARDPRNRWLSRMNVRRLDAESIRDTLLHLGGRLSARMYGEPDGVAAPLPRQVRRSIYLAADRNNPSPFLEVFDAPKPFTTLGRREITNVPAQSLALLNDPLVVYLAAGWARRTIEAEATVEGRVRRMFVEALGRNPDDGEVRVVRGYLAESERLRGIAENQAADSVAVWGDLAHALFNLKELIFVQ